MFEDRLLNVLPFAILILPLRGFVVLSLFGDWIKKDKEENRAGYLACATVIVAFGLAAWTTARRRRCRRRSTSCGGVPAGSSARNWTVCVDASRR